MTILEPLAGFIIGFLGTIGFGLLVYGFAGHEFRRHGYVEPEPEVDAVLQEEELNKEFSTFSRTPSELTAG